jgi:epoxyqueuosine reductase QueG
MIKKEGLVQSIIGIVEASPENSLSLETREAAFGSPLLGFSKGDDPLYDFLKKDIGEFYCHPAQIFEAAFPGKKVTGAQLTIICWILPQTEAIKRDQRKQTRYPSEKWSRARLFGEQFNNHVRTMVVELLQRDGYAAVAPVLSPLWEPKISEKYGFASTWSERHTAFISGLGTFGLSDGLITSVGKAVRIGSVIAEIDIEPTPRSSLSPTAYCLFYSSGKCMKCAKRCPAGAISATGHDKERCKTYIREIANPYTEEKFNLKTNSCGLCQTGVPCESRVPVRKKTAGKEEKR